MKAFQDYLTENSVTNKTKVSQVTLGGTTYTQPFISSGLWITDSRGNNLCECSNKDIAKDLAKILNSKI